MKSSHVIVAGATVFTIAGVVFAFLGQVSSEVPQDLPTPPPALSQENQGESQAPRITREPAPQAVHVDDLAANPDGFTGRVLIQGVVAGINQEEGVAALIDAREFEECGTVACATNYLPVRVDGTLPKPLSLVQVVGEVTTGASGLEVRADSVKDLK